MWAKISGLFDISKLSLSDDFLTFVSFGELNSKSPIAALEMYKSHFGKDSLTSSKRFAVVVKRISLKFG